MVIKVIYNGNSGLSYYCYTSYFAINFDYGVMMWLILRKGDDYCEGK